MSLKLLFLFFFFVFEGYWRLVFCFFLTICHFSSWFNLEKFSWYSLKGKGAGIDRTVPCIDLGFAAIVRIKP